MYPLADYASEYRQQQELHHKMPENTPVNLKWPFPSTSDYILVNLVIKI
jgi:hypothetical protein